MCALPLAHAVLVMSAAEVNPPMPVAPDPAMVAAWREKLQRGGVWANDPVPLYPYPSSPDYHRLFGPPDDEAWERAHAHYLAQFSDGLSDIQDMRPRPLAELEAACR